MGQLGLYVLRSILALATGILTAIDYGTTAGIVVMLVLHLLADVSYKED